MQRAARASSVLFGIALSLLGALDGKAEGATSAAAMVIHPIDADVEVTWRQPEQEKGRRFERLGYAFYAIGAFYDLYTTKRALDAGLEEKNPLMSRSESPRTTLASAVAVKIGFALVVGRLTRHSKPSTRGAWMLSYGLVQIGAGISNRNATIRARETTPLPTAATTSLLQEHETLVRLARNR